MTKIPKIPLSNPRPVNNGARIVLEGGALFLLFIFLPIFLHRAGFLAFKWLVLFYAVSAVSALWVIHHFARKKELSELTIQDYQEKINIVSQEILHEKQTYLAFEDKVTRYRKLKIIIEELNQDLSLEQIAQNLCDISFSLIAKGKGACLLYLIDRQTHSLSLYKAKKEDTGLVIKAKRGDLFDAWVSRHVAPLFVEDVRKDFRFDTAKLFLHDRRQVHSLISAPLVNEHRFQGVLRLDSPAANCYSQDDLRLLVTLCDFGAVALENSELFQKTRDLAIHDGLTQVYTKGYFLERLQEESRRSVRGSTALSLLMIDIDFFKQYNDTYGHSAGDIVLKQLCAVIGDIFADFTPLVGRFGGEEFCVLLPGVSKDKALQAAEALRAAIEQQTVNLRRQVTKVTVSIGVASYPGDTAIPDELFYKADQAMYQAKHRGRNRVVSA